MHWGRRVRDIKDSRISIATTCALPSSSGTSPRDNDVPAPMMQDSQVGFKHTHHLMPWRLNDSQSMPANQQPLSLHIPTRSALKCMAECIRSLGPSALAEQVCGRQAASWRFPRMPRVTTSRISYWRSQKSRRAHLLGCLQDANEFLPRPRCLVEGASPAQMGDCPASVGECSRRGNVSSGLELTYLHSRDPGLSACPAGGRGKEPHRLGRVRECV